MKTAATAFPDTGDEVTAVAAAPPALLRWPNTAAVLGKEAAASQSLEASVDWSSHAHNTGHIEVHSCMQVALMHGRATALLVCPTAFTSDAKTAASACCLRSAVSQTIGQSLGSCWELLGLPSSMTVEMCAHSRIISVLAPSTPPGPADPTA